MHPRTITKDMSPFDRFQVGDEVAHINVGDGTVTRNTREYVVVKFKSGATGEYDMGWFVANPTFLFHRNTKSANT